MTNLLRITPTAKIATVKRPKPGSEAVRIAFGKLRTVFVKGSDGRSVVFYKDAPFAQQLRLPGKFIPFADLRRVAPLRRPGAVYSAFRYSGL